MLSTERFVQTFHTLDLLPEEKTYDQSVCDRETTPNT